jgi:hypothetical protein
VSKAKCIRDGKPSSRFWLGGSIIRLLGQRNPDAGFAEPHFVGARVLVHVRLGFDLLLDLRSKTQLCGSQVLKITRYPPCIEKTFSLSRRSLAGEGLSR